MSQDRATKIDLSGVGSHIAIDHARRLGDSGPLIDYLRNYDHLTRELADLIADVLEGKLKVRRRKEPVIRDLRRTALPLYEWYSSVLLGTLSGAPEFSDVAYSACEDTLSELGFKGDLSDAATARLAARVLVCKHMNISQNKLERCLYPRTREGASVKKRAKKLTQPAGTTSDSLP